ncbi:MAG TPA: fumarylacetoacetate hydrolase family protein [Acetobacteraceae bacterium]|nr:fumarylacetoacetate hydrolase family protein [Acetobacteraceae bacterium]
MRLVTFEASGQRVGALDAEGRVRRLEFDGSMLDLIRAGGALPAQGGVVEGARILAPIPRPAKNIFCVGKNYHEHAKEFAGSGFDATAKEVVPEFPVVFSKPPTCVIGPGEPIPAHLDPTGSVDYEGELAVVIGRAGRGIARADALRHVFGYTIVNDVTARTLQHRHRQWILGKGLDGFAPMGPAILTADEVPDPRALRLTTHVNGERRQDAPVADLIFDIPTLIETISAGITLEPGDIIATGTPAGVGIGFTPPRFLARGDMVRVEVAGIGVLENPVG